MHHCNKTTKEIFRTIKNWRREKTAIPPLLGPRGVAYSDKEKSKTMADSLEKRFITRCAEEEAETTTFETSDTSSDEEEEQTTSTDTENDEPDQPPQPQPIRPTTYQELNSLIHRLNTHKATGPDYISNQALKLAITKIKARLLNIINGTLRQNYFPPTWKMANDTRKTIDQFAC